jgi:hypothetical protein
MLTRMHTGMATGVDGKGDFGVPGANLYGDSFSLVFTVDTTKGTLSTESGLYGFTYIQGGTGYYAYLGSTPVSAVLSIDGHSYSNFTSLGNSYGIDEFGPNYTYANIASQGVFTSTDPTIVNYIYIRVFMEIAYSGSGSNILLSLTAPYELAITGPVSGSGAFNDLASCGGCPSTNVFLSPTSVVLSETPLPTSLSMMLIGLAGFDLMMGLSKTLRRSTPIEFAPTKQVRYSIQPRHRRDPRPAWCRPAWR